MVFYLQTFSKQFASDQLKSYSVSTGLVHIKTIAVFITRVQWTWQKPCSAKYVVGNASNNSFTFPRSSGKYSLHSIQKFDHSCVCDITRASSSLYMSMKRSWMMESHSLTIVSWRKGISASNFVRNVNL